MQKNFILRYYNASKKLEQVLNQLLKPFQLTMRLFVLLHLIQNTQNSVPSLQKSLGTNKSTLSRQLNQLVQRKLIHSTMSTNNHQKHYQLTAAGLQVLNRANTAINQINTQLFKYWSKEEAQLFNVLLDRFQRDITQRLE
ncbi:MAG: transcriptional regulator [Lactobacillus sp.]|jgi:DNA-binding MarR family transcriptional regulator|nr:transcriptional regulator [Lactobacillus sp.]